MASSAVWGPVALSGVVHGLLLGILWLCDGFNGLGGGGSGPGSGPLVIDATWDVGRGSGGGNAAGELRIEPAPRQQDVAREQRPAEADTIEPPRNEVRPREGANDSAVRQVAARGPEDQWFPAPAPRPVPADPQGAGGNGGPGDSGGGDGAGDGAGGTGREGRTFFAIDFGSGSSSGAKVAFAIDNSESMLTGDAYRVARRELVRAIDSLRPEDQFQVILYDLDPHLIQQAGGRKGLISGNAAGKQRARHVIDGTPVQGGTDHLAALKAALRLKPDVVILLTDADYPVLSAGDLDELRRLNGGRARVRIDAVEFGEGAGLKRDNFLTRLASEHRGTHRYVDLTREVRAAAD